MKIKSEDEYRRCIMAMNRLGDSMCHPFFTSDKPNVASPYYCKSPGVAFGPQELYGEWIDPFCMRMFPEIIGTSKCPCDALPANVIKDRVLKAMARWKGPEY